jgi:Calcineurin-like phosphoesterase/Purple acid Phosphatase, N-terminal domain
MNESNKISRKKQILKSVLLTFLIISPLGIIVGITYYDYMSDPDVKAPYITWYDNPAKEICISWESNTIIIGEVRYGTEKGNLNNSTSELLSTQIHHINLTNLISNTKYYYEVYNGQNKHGSGTFQTAPDSKNSDVNFTWAITSDTQQPKITEGHFGRIGKAIQNKNISFLAITGDLVDEGDNRAHWNNFFTQGASFMNTIPLVPVMGNHDWKGKNESDFYRYFPNNRNNSINNYFFYSFNFSMVHFTICHFTYAYNSELNDDQINWIKQDLKNAQDKSFRVIMFHCPIIGAGFYGEDSNLKTKLVPILHEYNVSAVFNGHEHHYERGYIKDTNNQWSNGNQMLYMVLGAGGGAFDPGLRPLEGAQVMTTAPCYVEVQSSKNLLHFKALSPEGAVYDDVTLDTEGNIQ